MVGRKRVTPAPGKSRGPHPPSPPSEDVLELVSDLPRVGYITRNPTGYVFLDLNDGWIDNLESIMEKFGYQRPPYFYGGQGVGAHVTILPAFYGKKHPDTDVEVGRKITFKISGAAPFYPRYGEYGTEAIYMIRIESPDLDHVLESFKEPDYNPGYGGFHIVVGIRTLRSRDEMIKK